MKITKKMILPVLALTVVGASVLGTSATVSADSNVDSLVEKIASRFNLNQDEVQAVFDEARDEKHAEHQAELSENLQAKVDDGTITAEQMTLIEQKLEEKRAQREANRDQDLTREERRVQHEQEREEFKTWAEENNIPLEELDLRQHKGPGGPHRHGGDE